MQTARTLSRDAYHRSCRRFQNVLESGPLRPLPPTAFSAPNWRRCIRPLARSSALAVS